MRILITGGSGYIGSIIAQYLFKLGYCVAIASRNARAIPFLKGIRICDIDWYNPDSIANVCNDIDLIIHAAGMNASECQNDPVTAFEFNALCTARLLRAAIDKKVSRIIYLSTAHVYSDSMEGYINEKTCPDNLHPYATSHLAAEKMILYAHKKHQIEGIVLRMSNVVACPVVKEVNCWMLLVPDLCKQAILERKLVLNTDGRNWRNFIGVSDVCRAINHLSSLTQEKIGDGLFNLGGERSFTIMEMAEIIAERVFIIKGWTPPIMPNIKYSTTSKNELLNYNIDRIKETGFKLSSKNIIIPEIDNLLSLIENSI